MCVGVFALSSLLQATPAGVEEEPPRAPVAAEPALADGPLSPVAAEPALADGPLSHVAAEPALADGEKEARTAKVLGNLGSTDRGGN